MWKVEFYNNEVETAAIKLPSKLRAKLLQLLERIETIGILNELHSKSLGDGLFEIRAKSAEGIARGIYCYLSDKRIIVLHIFIKKTQKISVSDLSVAKKRLIKVKGGYYGTH